jgi:hypothetical protein
MSNDPRYLAKKRWAENNREKTREAARNWKKNAVPRRVSKWADRRAAILAKVDPLTKRYKSGLS